MREGARDRLESAAMPETPSFFQRLRNAFSRNESAQGKGLASDLARLIGPRRIDAAALDELETRLLAADVGVEVTETLLEDLRRRVARQELGDVESLLKALRTEIVRQLMPAERALDFIDSRKPFVIMVVGVNGSGKTTTIGKLATRLRAEGKRVMLAAGDTFRAAAVEQLGIWAERSGAELIAQTTGADPAAVGFDALGAARSRGADVLIIDTAGRLQAQTQLMEELKKIRRVLGKLDPTAPHEVLLVLDANQGQNALRQAEQFTADVGVSGLVLTKLDGSAKGGIVLAIVRKLGLPIRYVGIGEGSEDFGPFSAEAFADALIGKTEQS